MDNSWKKEKRANFEAWIQTLETRLAKWFSMIDPQFAATLDFSPESLDEVEKYLVEKYDLKDLKNPKNKTEIDAAASYILKVFSLNWSNPRYVIELDDEKNILFNRPAIITQPQIGMAFSPYQILPSTINLKRIGGMRKVLESKKRQYAERYGSKK